MCAAWQVGCKVHFRVKRYMHPQLRGLYKLIMSQASHSNHSKDPPQGMPAAVDCSGTARAHIAGSRCAGRDAGERAQQMARVSSGTACGMQGFSSSGKPPAAPPTPLPPSSTNECCRMFDAAQLEFALTSNPFRRTAESLVRRPAESGAVLRSPPRLHVRAGHSHEQGRHRRRDEACATKAVGAACRHGAARNSVLRSALISYQNQKKKTKKISYQLID